MEARAVRKEKKPEGGASWRFQKKQQPLSNPVAESEHGSEQWWGHVTHPRS